MKRFFGNLIDILCLSSCGIFACIVTKTVPCISDLNALLCTDECSLPLVPAIMAGVALLLMLVFRRITKMVWNIVYCVTTIVMLATLLHWATRGMFFPPVLQEMVAPYSIPVLLEGGYYYELGSFGLLWLMGALCCHGFWRVTITAVVSYSVWLILALLLHIASNAWLGMADPPVAHMQGFVRDWPWLTAAFPGCFVLIYALLMSIYDALFMGWPSKKSEEKTADAPATTPGEDKAPSKPASSRPIPSKPTPSRPIPSRPTASRPLVSKPTPSRPLLTKTAATKPVLTKPAEKAVEKPAEKAVEKPAETPAEKPVEKPAEKPAERPAAEEKPAVDAPSAS